MNTKTAPLRFLDDVITRHKNGTDPPASAPLAADQDPVFSALQDALMRFARGEKNDAKQALVALAAANPTHHDLLVILARFFGAAGQDPYLAKHYHDQATRLSMNAWLSS
jgi:hypothetical protein